MTRRGSVLSIALTLIVGALVPASAAAAGPAIPFPDTMAAVGDSITQAASTAGSLGADAPQNSWSTGTSAGVNSHYLRLLAAGAPISGQNHNRSVSGAKMAGLQGQVATLADLDPDYLTVLIGGNDVCTPTEGQMTSVADFRSQFQAAMATLRAVSPGTAVYVVSIPRVMGLYELFRNNFWARFIWSVGGVCQSLLANPTSTNQADVDRRARVDQRNRDFNAVLAEVCASAAAQPCLWDAGAAFNTAFATSDVSGDYFHPSTAGQAKLAAVSWASGYTWVAAPPQNQLPSASFVAGCSGLACTFTNTSTDADGTLTHAWTFGDGISSTAVSPTKTYGTAGTYTVGLTVTDDDGATATTSQSVTVSAPTLRVTSLTGTSGVVNKKTWRATVTITVADGTGVAVPNATVSGGWTVGAADTCTTGTGGTCTVTSDNLTTRTISSVTFTVTGVNRAGYTYVPGDNVTTSVVVQRP